MPIRNRSLPGRHITVTGGCERRDASGESSANLASLIKEPLADLGAHARDIAKNACFQLLLVEAVLHQITDTHDALQLVVLDNRQVTDPRYRHCRKHSIHAIGGATTEDGRRHQLLDLQGRVWRRRLAPSH